ncbi:MAG: SDR family oxidoreductase [Bacteroidia bacterium]
MAKTYLFAGASSSMALKTASILQKEGHHVIGLSTKENAYTYNQFYQVEKYENSFLPIIDTPIDGLVYFPGTINLKPFNRLTAKDFVTDYEINALGAVAFTQFYLNQLKQSSSASIVFISSVAAQSGMPFHASVAMAKAALEGLTKSLAAELAPIVRVNAIAPSLTNTPLADKFINTPEKTEASQKRNPMKKVGTPEEVGDAIAFLLSEKSSWITGQIIAVDGGMNNLKL